MFQLIYGIKKKKTRNRLINIENKLTVARGLEGKGIGELGRRLRSTNFQLYINK